MTKFSQNIFMIALTWGMLAIGGNGFLNAQTDSGTQVFSATGTGDNLTLEVNIANDITINGDNEIVSIEIIDMVDNGIMLIEEVDCGETYGFDFYKNDVKIHSRVCKSSILATGISDASTIKIEAVPASGFEGLAAQLVTLNTSITIKVTWNTCVANAGTGATVTPCKNAPIDLESYLSGNPQAGGTWYDAEGSPLVNANITAPNLQGQYHYSYIVTVDSECSDEATIIVDVQDCNYLAVDEYSLNNLSIYPNPARNAVTISGITEGNNTLEILNLEGKVVLTQSVSELDVIDIEHLPSGIYLGVISNEKATQTVKIVKE